MKTHQDIEIQLTPDEAGAFADELERSLEDGWSRNRVREQDVTGLMTGRQMYCFERALSPGHHGAEVWLTMKEGPALYVSNIIPT